MQTFELIRQKRKTLAISVKQGRVVVSAPLKLPTVDIEKFLIEKTDWINKKLADYKRKTELFSDITEYKNLLIEGERYPIILSDTVRRIAFNGERLLVPQKYGDKKSMIKAIWNFYAKIAAAELKNRLDGISEKTGLLYGTFSLTNAKGKWGSCDGENNIMLNSRLYMLNSRLTEYVIIHELCHTLHHNHSANFWSAVSRFCPDYKNLRKELKNYSIINELFR